MQGIVFPVFLVCFFPFPFPLYSVGGITPLHHYTITPLSHSDFHPFTSSRFTTFLSTFILSYFRGGLISP